jgi:hypothetical protein
MLHMVVFTMDVKVDMVVGHLGVENVTWQLVLSFNTKSLLGNTHPMEHVSLMDLLLNMLFRQYHLFPLKRMQ